MFYIEQRELSLLHDCLPIDYEYKTIHTPLIIALLHDAGPHFFLSHPASNTQWMQVWWKKSGVEHLEENEYIKYLGELCSQKANNILYWIAGCVHHWRLVTCIVIDFSVFKDTAGHFVKYAYSLTVDDNVNSILMSTCPIFCDVQQTVTLFYHKDRKQQEKLV